MQIDPVKLDLALARSEKSLADMRKVGFSPSTLCRLRRGCAATPKMVGRVAKALGVDVTEILAEEEKV